MCLVHRTCIALAAPASAYVAYITKLFTLAGQPAGGPAAQRILALETAIATKQWDRVRSRDRNASYNKMSVAELSKLMPSYDWKSYLDAAKLSKASDVIVRQARLRRGDGLPHEGDACGNVEKVSDRETA